MIKTYKKNKKVPEKLNILLEKIASLTRSQNIIKDVVKLANLKNEASNKMHKYNYETIKKIISPDFILIDHRKINIEQLENSIQRVSNLTRAVIWALDRP